MRSRGQAGVWLDASRSGCCCCRWFSGLLLVLCWSVAGLRRLRADRVALGALGAWGLGGFVGAMAGGSYWSHYLIQLIPFAAVTASVGLAGASRWSSRTTTVTLAACVIGGVTIGPATAKPEGRAGEGHRQLRG